jgi:hypothetical protein
VTGRRSNQLSYSRVSKGFAETWDLKGPPLQVKDIENPCGTMLFAIPMQKMAYFQGKSA